MCWDMITALSTVFMSLVIFITVIFALLQLIEIKKARRFDAFLNIAKFLQRDDIREARLFLLSKLWKDVNIKDISPDDDYKLGKALSIFEALGEMVSKKVVEKELILGQYQDTIIRSWEQVEQLIFQYREKWGSNIRKKFEFLYNEAKKRQMKNLENNIS